MKLWFPLVKSNTQEVRTIFLTDMIVGLILLERLHKIDEGKEKHASASAHAFNI